MLGLLAWAFMGACCAKDSYDNSKYRQESYIRSKSSGLPYHMDSKGRTIHNRTGKECLIRYSGKPDAVVVLDTHYNILEVTGDLTDEEVAKIMRY